MTEAKDADFYNLRYIKYPDTGRKKEIFIASAFGTWSNIFI